MKSKISVHFDGPIARNHTVQLRTFSRALEHIQTAIDRAYLDVKYGTIWKNARLLSEDYAPTDFLLKQTREGGFIADLLGDDNSDQIVQRINQALTPAYERARAGQPIESEKLVDLAELRRKHYAAGAQKPIAYDQFLASPDTQQTRAYGDRSIVKEFDQIASAIRARDNDGSLVEIDFHVGRALPKFIFDAHTSLNFHKVVSVRSIGDLVTIPVTLRSLDAGNGGISRAKAYNLASQKEFNLHIHTERGFSSLRKYLKKKDPPVFSIVAAPVLEYNTFDPLAGDMYFIALDKSVDDD